MRQNIHNEIPFRFPLRAQMTVGTFKLYPLVKCNHFILSVLYELKINEGGLRLWKAGCELEKAWAAV